MKTWLIAHDAGGAELIAAWAIANQTKIAIIASGPALRVFQRKFPREPLRGIEALSEIEKSDFVLTGTGGGEFERSAIRNLKNKNVYVTSFMDHWVNYLRRFRELDGSLCLPDEIWFADSDAYRLGVQIFSEFKNLKLIQKNNDYLDSIRNEIRAIEEKLNLSSDEVRILYICEGPPEDFKEENNQDPLEFRAIKKYLNWVQQQSWINKIKSIRFRTHPSEKPSKYDLFLSQFSELSIELSRNTTLAEDCAWANRVVGLSSMALVISLACGKLTYSCIPDQAYICPLPLEGLVHL